MGDRSEIYIRNADLTIELWRHWDSDPQFMIPFFEKFASFAIRTYHDQQHRLTYPEDVAALMIVFDYLEDKETLEKLRRQYKGKKTDPLFIPKPDLRPRGNIEDFERIWILDIPDTNQNGIWKVSYYRLNNLDFLPPENEREDLKPLYKGKVQMTTDEFRKAIREKKEPIKPEIERVLLHVTVVPFESAVVIG
jgi:hypothetical protein